MISFIAAAATSTGNTSSGAIIVFCTVASVAIAGAVALYTVLNNRNTNEERKAKDISEEKETDRSDLKKVSDTLSRFMLAMVGKAADPENGLPAVPGFTDEVRAHNLQIDKKFSQVWEELTTENGGGTIKGSLKNMQTNYEALDTKVDSLTTTVNTIAGDTAK